jgi:hypothetical protein
MFRRLQKQLHDTELGTGSGTTGTRTCTYVQVQWGYRRTAATASLIELSKVLARSEIVEKSEVVRRRYMPVVGCSIG